MTVHIDRAVWAAAQLSVQDLGSRGPLSDPFRRVLVRSDGNRRGAVLAPELVRSLRDWMSWWLGDHGESPPPAAPDAVRMAVDEQRAALRRRSSEQVSEDFRAGLAWADNALDAIDRTARGTGVAR